MSLTITLLANKSNTFGIQKDIEALTKAFLTKGHTVSHCDPLEPPVKSDILIHIEVPSYGWAPWATKNIILVNPEHWQPAWDPYLSKFDMVVTRDTMTEDLFRAKGHENVVYVPWGLAPSEPIPFPELDEFVWVLGGSKNKRAFVPILLRAWKETYPKLTITTTSAFDLSGVTIPTNVSIINRELTPDDRLALFSKFKGHVCCSRAEGFGYTAAEAEQIGAFTILNSLPCYVSNYAKSTGVAFLPSKLENTYYDVGDYPENFRSSLDQAMVSFAHYTTKMVKVRQTESADRWNEFCKTVSLFLTPQGVTRFPITPALPPLLHPTDCPPISIVTLIYNRKKFFDLACHSLMITDYPQTMIEWIIVDDSDDPMEQNSDTIMKVANASTTLKIAYYPLKRKTPVSDKRNYGVSKATNDIVLFMDDDDHYPETSIRRRVAWLTKHSWKPEAVACTTIACYDLVKGISAVNVPPLDLPLSQRISEATLTFYKAWWQGRAFQKGITVGEGEGFVQGRETDVLEIPPQQIIVAFSHGKNVSSRRVPSDSDVKPGCFWEFPKEFLVFIHGLAGVNIIS